MPPKKKKRAKLAKDEPCPDKITEEEKLNNLGIFKDNEDEEDDEEEEDDDEEEDNEPWRNFG